MANPSIVVDFVADTSGLNKGFSQASSSAGGFGSKLKGLAGGAALGGAVAGVGALTAALKIGIDEYSQSSKVAAQTAAVLKSTGGAAGVTAGQVDQLATSIMKKSGMDDEAVKSGENLLLTFTNIHNQTGKGNDIFNQATNIMADMSTALGQDMTTSAIQLGKALNNPTKGVTALQRVGVSFTQSQKDQIKALQDSGHTMEAQKIILGELTKEFGGSAEAAGKTLPGQLSILRESFNNFAGDLVAKAIPYLERFMSFLRDNWPQVQAVIQEGFKAVQPLLAALGGALLELGRVVVSVVKVVVDHWNQIAPIVAAVGDRIKGTIQVITGILKLFSALLRGDWSGAWRALQQVIGGVVRTIVATVKMTLLPLKLILGALWTGLKLAAAAAWNGIKTQITTVTNAIKTVITTTWNGVKTVTTTAWNGIKTAVTTVVNAIKTVVTTAWNGIKTAVSTAVTAIQTNVTTRWNTLKTNVTTTVNAIKTAVTTAWNTLKTAVTTAVNSLQTTVTTVWNAIKSVIQTTSTAIQGAINTFVTWIKKPGTAADDMLADIKKAFNAVEGVIRGALGAIKNAVDSVVHAIKDPINAVLGAFNALRIPGFTLHIGMPGPVPDINFGWGGADLPNIPLLARGGVIDSPTLLIAGEGQGREIVTPEALLRQIMGEQAVEVHVYIGDEELRGLVRTEVVRGDQQLARTLLAGTV